MRTFLVRAGFLCLLTASATVAPACSVCVYAQIDMLFPPAAPWSVLGAIAYPIVLLLGRVRGDGGATSMGMASYAVGWGVYLVAMIAAGLIMGPIPLLILLMLAVAELIRMWLRGNPGKPAIVTSVLLGVAMLATGIVSVVQDSNRDEVAKIVRWQGTAATRQMVYKMERRGDVAVLRRVVAANAGGDSAMAADALGKLGTTAEDGPLLIDALKRAETTPADSWLTGRFASALENLLGGTPPTGTGSADWELLLESQQEI